MGGGCGYVCNCIDSGDHNKMGGDKRGGEGKRLEGGGEGKRLEGGRGVEGTRGRKGRGWREGGV